jgi:CRP/FNR family transcriptional regulator, cyclic AMP receptor protein
LNYGAITLNSSHLISETLLLVPWLAAAGTTVVSQLAMQSHVRSHRNGEEVARRGQTLNHLIVVANGKLESSMTSANGKHHVVGYLTRGMVFGLIPVLDGKPCIHDAVTQGSSQVIVLPQAALMDELAKNPTLMLGAFKLLCGRSRMLYGLLSDQSLLSTQARVARQLLMLATGFGGRSGLEEPALVIELPQSSLADMLGLTRQSLNLELKRLEKSGLIRIAYSRIELVDKTQLQKLTE